eukprot:3634820-Rhodomonas_salina.2
MGGWDVVESATPSSAVRKEGRGEEGGVRALGGLAKSSGCRALSDKWMVRGPERLVTSMFWPPGLRLPNERVSS